MQEGVVMSDEIIVKMSLSDQIYSLLKKQIINGQLKQGERINIEAIAKKYNVSRTPIREALNRLQQEGFVENIHNVGPSVVKFESEDIVELIYVNRILFSGVIELLFKNCNMKLLLAELKKCLDQQILAHENNDFESFLNYSVEFHRILIKNCGNKRIKQLTLQTQTQLDIGVLNYVKIEENKEKGINDHKKIYEALENNDMKGAIEIMEKHNVDAEEFYNKA